MAFGPIMQLKAGELSIELAPINRDDLGEFVAPGMQQASITKYLGRRNAPVFEDEQEWFDRTRKEENSIVWGIYVHEKESRRLIGNTALTHIEHDPLLQSTSGSMIFRKEYWGKGIASSIHRARTWYAFEQLGHIRIKSAVIQGNIASKKALEKVGYEHIYTERNTAFIDGRLRHQDNLAVINPSDRPWLQWWGDDTPSASALAARQRALEAMEWASKNVTLL